MPETLTRPVARRIALAAQGLADPRQPAPDTWVAIRRVLERTALLQIDSVNVLARAHYLPLFSRLGPYARPLLESAAWGRPRRLFEYWAHEASLLPLDMQPLFRWRMARAERGEGIYGGLKPFATERRAEADRVLEQIRERGPLSASELEGTRGAGGWWGWSDAKQAVEWLFWAGLITTRTRRNTFERVYDLSERVWPAEIRARPTPSEADAHRDLLRIAARSLGVATAMDLRDYFRMRPDATAPRLAELVETGELIPVTVEGWTHSAYLHRDARWPRRAQGRALLAPFDPLIWERSRTERLFGLRYRIEIYTPVEKRLHGYYVLPFLLGDRIVARVDLKADRQGRLLLVQNAHEEPGAPADVVDHLVAELTSMAEWLGLDRIVVGEAGDLSVPLRAALPRHTGAAPTSDPATSGLTA